MNSGKVYLVGAGCGDPDLITVKGLRLLQTADVIVYDRLAPTELLQSARHDAELIDAGKLPQKHRLDQTDINAVLIAKAQEGKQVVRLKGGDPFVFGRGGEEALACYEANIAFEVVPGISSAIAVPAYAGIPVTHRQVATSFTVFTGHESTEASSLDYEALAKMGTLVALMGVSHLGDITQKLISAGMKPSTPACCIEWGTTPQQRTIVGTLTTIHVLAQEANLQPPSITVIGEVVGLRDKGLRWFDVLR
jgi:uroporphyrinogen III methyltransferase/synthase